MIFADGKYWLIAKCVAIVPQPNSTLREYYGSTFLYVVVAPVKHYYCFYEHEIKAWFCPD